MVFHICFRLAKSFYEQGNRSRFYLEAGESVDTLDMELTPDLFAYVSVFLAKNTDYLAIH